jgi:hypothetical protein
MFCTFLFTSFILSGSGNMKRILACIAFVLALYVGTDTVRHSGIASEILYGVLKI